jgi:hypothetical protein
MDWLDVYPQCVVSAHAEMLPVLMAEEAMLGAVQGAVGGSLKKGSTLTRQWADWRRAANRRAKPKVGKVGDLAAIGIGVKVAR